MSVRTVDERMSWLGWLTCSGRFCHISGLPSAAGWVQDRESSPAKDWHRTTVTRNKRVYGVPSCSVRYSVGSQCVCHQQVCPTLTNHICHTPCRPGYTDQAYTGNVCMHGHSNGPSKELCHFWWLVLTEWAPILF